VRSQGPSLVRRKPTDELACVNYQLASVIVAQCNLLLEIKIHAIPTRYTRYTHKVPVVPYHHKVPVVPYRHNESMYSVIFFSKPLPKKSPMRRKSLSC